MTKRIFAIVLASLLLLPQGVVFAASGAVGSVETLSATALDEATTEARASVYVANQGTAFLFEYGPTESLGRRTYPYYPSAGKIQLIPIRIPFLTSGVTYYYRAVIEGSTGTVYGNTQSFVAGFGNDKNLQSGSTANSTGNANGSTNGNTTGNTGTSNGGTVSYYPGTNVPMPSSNGNTANGAGTVVDGQSTPEANAATGDNGTGATNPGGFFQRLFDAVTGANPMQVSVKMDPEKPAARQIIEYAVTYRNGSDKPIGGGTLSVVLPDTVVYVSDNSGGKTVLSHVDHGAKLTLTTEALAAKGSRTLTLMAIATSQAVGTSPTALVDLAYVNQQGVLQRVTTREGNANTTAVAAVAASQSSQTTANDTVTPSSSNGFLPSSFLSWVIFIVVVTLIIVGVRRTMAVYRERKKAILDQEAQSRPRTA